MIADLRVGDYIEKSELDTEQKYNDVVEVFKSFGFEFRGGAICGFDMLKVNSAMVLSCNIVFICLDCEVMDRKLTYIDIMSLKKVDVNNCNELTKDGNKYHREIIGFCGTKVEVDIYRVLDAFKTGSAALDHAAKKILCAGARGHKDYVTDIDNAIESLQEAKALHLQKVEIDNA